MGKFDGYLICSDLDGTIAFGTEPIQANIPAIRYFTENGGKFTICSGRYYYYLLDLYEKFYTNTYLIGLGGAEIRDPKSDDILYMGYIDDDAFRIIDEIITKDFPIEKYCFYQEGEQTRGIALTKEEYQLRKKELCEMKLQKIVFLTASNDDSLIALRRFSMEIDLKTYDLGRSWPTGIEMYPLQNDKAMSTHRLKDKIGAHTLICVGNYENDISMVKNADIGYAVSDSAESLLAVAHKVGCSANDGIIAQIVFDIENGLILPQNKQ